MSETKPAIIETFFTLERETKGAVRYMETNNSGHPKEMGVPFEDGGAAVGTLYIRKTALKELPKALRVQIYTH